MGGAIITGGGRGLGKSMAMHAARAGHDVILTYISKQAEAEAVRSEIQQMGRKSACLQLNVANSGALPDFASSIARLPRDIWQREDFDFLVNNAGIGINAPFAETTEEQFDLLMNIPATWPRYSAPEAFGLTCSLQERSRPISAAERYTITSM